jgi:hypothetical protein
MNMSRAREAWRFQVDGAFLGAFLGVVGDVVVFSFRDQDHYATLGAVTTEGHQLWVQRWEDFCYFFSSQGRLYVDGDKARRICPATGCVEAERDLGRSVEIWCALPAGPVYVIPEEKRFFGLDAGGLATLWEWHGGDSWFHDFRICRYRPEDGISIFALPSLSQYGPVQTAALPEPAVHSHAGDVWCHFGTTGGGRRGIDLRTGETVWHFADPSAYGLMTFDDTTGYSPSDGMSAYDLRTGRQLWKREFRAQPSSVAAVANGRVYFATGDEYVHVLDAGTGEAILSHQLDFTRSDAMEPSPVVPLGENRIIVGTYKEIICLEIE